MIRNLLPVILATSALSLGSTAGLAAEVNVNATAPVIELSVSEEVRGSPDTATVNTGVTTRAMTAREGLRLNGAEVERLIAAIKKMGVADKNIQTSGININAQYDYRDNDRKFLGYDVSNNLTVRVEDISRLGEIIDAMVDAGANNLNGPNFFIDDETAFKKTARDRALDKGKELADYYARKAGYSSARLISISEGISGRGGPPPPMAMAAARDESMNKTPVEPGEVGVSVNLSLTYEMVR